MKTIVIFNSQTGFTRRYAEWIAEATGADFMELSLAKQKDLTAYEAVIFGGMGLRRRNPQPQLVQKEYGKLAG